MKNPDRVFRELGDLYEFYRQVKRFKINEKTQPDASQDTEQSPPKSRSGGNSIAVNPCPISTENNQ